MKVPGEDHISNRVAVLPSGGTWQGLSGMLYGYLVGVRSRPTTASTIYNLRIVDKDGFEVYERKGVRGELVAHPLHIPIRGYHTVYIEESTVDESFNLKLMVEGI